MHIKFYLKLTGIMFTVLMLLELAFLLFLNNYYLANNSSFEIIQSVSPSVNVSQDQAHTLKLPEEAEALQFSNDAKYICYILHNKIYLVSVADGLTSIITPESTDTISNFKFVQDRDRLIIAEKNKANAYIKLYSYDILAKSKAAIYSQYHDDDLQLKLNSKTENVTDIQMSPLTNLIYIKLSDDNGNSRIYCLNIMAKTSIVSLPYRKIGNMSLIYGDDILYYEAPDNGRVYMKGSNDYLKLQSKSRFFIVGTDENDQLYLAAESDGKTSCVYYGTKKTDWTKKELNRLVNISDVHVTFSGMIFVNDTTNGILYNISNGRKILYSGSLAGITDKGIFTLQEGSISYRAF